MIVVGVGGVLILDFGLGILDWEVTDPFLAIEKAATVLAVAAFSIEMTVLNQTNYFVSRFARVKI